MTAPRAVEVLAIPKVSGVKPSYGSGTHLGGGLVLTCAHIIPRQRRAHRLVIRENGREPIEVDVGWLNRADDLALLVVYGDGAAAAMLGLLPMEPDLKVPCVLRGWPRAVETQVPGKGAVRDMVEVLGEVRLAEYRVAKRGRIRLHTEKRFPARAGDSWWSGMSGAALWVGPTIVAVQTGQPNAAITDYVDVQPLTPAALATEDQERRLSGLELLARCGVAAPKELPVGTLLDLQISAHDGALFGTAVIFGSGQADRVDAGRRPLYWLNPHNPAVTYAEPREMKFLYDWCTDAVGLYSVRLLHAPGGTGKTRLSVELVRGLTESRTGWVAGLVTNDHELTLFLNVLPGLIRAGAKVFCAIDYAETSIKALKQLIGVIRGLAPGHIRVLLLARSADSWWEHLAEARWSQGVVDPQAVPLTDIGSDAQASSALALTAYRSFRRVIRDDPDASTLPMPLALADHVQLHTRALDLLAASLVQVVSEQGVSLDPKDPLQALLAHEREYWLRAASTRAGAEFAEVDRLADRILSLPTLCPSFGADEAERAIARMPEPHDRLPASAEGLANVLANLYPPQGDWRFWSPLLPDRVGEKLLADVIRRAGAERNAEELLRAIGDVDSVQASYVITLLQRLFVGGYGSDVSDKTFAIMNALGRERPATFGKAVTIIASGLTTDTGADRLRPLAAGWGDGPYHDSATICGSAYHSWIGVAYSAARPDHRAYQETRARLVGAWECVLARSGLHAHDDVRTIVCGPPASCPAPSLPAAVAALDDDWILVDPMPTDAAPREFARLAALPQASWGDFDRAARSNYSVLVHRHASTVMVPAALVEYFQSGVPGALDGDLVEMSPKAIIDRMLTAPIDVLWLGTPTVLVTGTGESFADRVTVTADRLRCSAIAELHPNCVTAAARTAFAARGGSIAESHLDAASNIDAYDYEININSVLDTLRAAGAVSGQERVARLGQSAAFVAAAVTQRGFLRGLSLRAAVASGSHVAAERLAIIELERRGRLDRAIDSLPDETELTTRQARATGLLAPEHASLRARVQIDLKQRILDADFGKEPWASKVLYRYFPPALRDYESALEDHPLRAEIVSASLATDAVDLLGPAFAYQAAAGTRRPIAEVMRAFVVTSQLFDIDNVVAELYDKRSVNQAAMLSAHRDLGRVLTTGIRWMMHQHPNVDVVALTNVSSSNFRHALLLFDAERASAVADRPRRDPAASGFATYAALGSHAKILLSNSREIAELLLCHRLCAGSVANVPSTTQDIMAVSRRLRLDMLKAMIERLPADDRWQARAKQVLLHDVWSVMAQLCAAIVASTMSASAWLDMGHAALSTPLRKSVEDTVATLASFENEFKPQESWPGRSLDEVFIFVRTLKRAAHIMSTAGAGT